MTNRNTVRHSRVGGNPAPVAQAGVSAVACSPNSNGHERYRYVKRAIEIPLCAAHQESSRFPIAPSNTERTPVADVTIYMEDRQMVFFCRKWQCAKSLRPFQVASQHLGYVARERAFEIGIRLATEPAKMPASIEAGTIHIMLIDIT
jgi:hypothetical protein